MPCSVLRLEWDVLHKSPAFEYLLLGWWYFRGGLAGVALMEEVYHWGELLKDPYHLQTDLSAS